MCKQVIFFFELGSTLLINSCLATVQKHFLSFSGNFFFFDRRLANQLQHLGFSLEKIVTCNVPYRKCFCCCSFLQIWVNIVPYSGSTTSYFYCHPDGQRKKNLHMAFSSITPSCAKALSVGIANQPNDILFWNKFNWLQTGGTSWKWFCCDPWARGQGRECKSFLLCTTFFFFSLRFLSVMLMDSFQNFLSGPFFSLSETENVCLRELLLIENLRCLSQQFLVLWSKKYFF